MKTLKTLALALALLLALSACGAIRSDDGPTQAAGGSAPAEEPAEQPPQEEARPEEEPVEAAALRVGALKGPTAMGLIRMISDDGVNRYTLAGSADELTPKLIKGELDIACVPANLAAVLYNKTEGQVVTLAVNTLGVLYIVENGGETVRSMADLKGRPSWPPGRAPRRSSASAISWSKAAWTRTGT